MFPIIILAGFCIGQSVMTVLAVTKGHNYASSIWVSVTLWWFLFILIRAHVLTPVQQRVRDHLVKTVVDYTVAYAALPPYDVMLLSVRHFHRWTYAQWLAYAVANLDPEVLTLYRKENAET